MSQDPTMRQPRPHLLSALLACAGLAQAQTPPPGPPLTWTLGYATCQLRPATGHDQRLNGIALGGEYGLSPAWSVELALSHQTGTEADTGSGRVNLRQSGALAGPRYTLPLGRGGRWQGSAHLLVGRELLQASSGDAQAQGVSFAFTPGVALQCQLASRLALRIQEDLACTHYAGENQRSPTLFVGLALR
jgi:hypothetical protein